MLPDVITKGLSLCLEEENSLFVFSRACTSHGMKGRNCAALLEEIKDNLKKSTRSPPRGCDHEATTG